MAQYGFYVDVGQTFSKGNPLAATTSKSWYIIQHPYKGGGEVTQWDEMIIEMGATTFDTYRVTKDIDGVVAGTYQTDADLANAGFDDAMKELGGHCYFVLMDTSDLVGIIGEWSA